MRRRTTTVLGIVAATTLLAACGSNDADVSDEPDPGGTASADASTTPTDSSTPTSSTTSSTPPEGEGSTGPTFPEGTEKQFAKNKGKWDLSLRDIRIGEHEGFDRVVLEFKGTGTPGWDVRYVKTPRAEGSGDVVDVQGDQVLMVNVSGVTLRKGFPETPADSYTGPRHFEPEDSDVVEDVHRIGMFEGYDQLFLGIDGDKAPFRVSALTKPSRLVIDVQDD